MKASLKVKIGKLELKNPVMAASGTFGYAEEFKSFMDLKKIGALVSKTITLNPRQGNPPPRTAETPAGLLNSIGLENPGLEVFLKDRLPFLKKIGAPIIVSIASEESPREFVDLAARLDKISGVAAIELNISCPNVGHRLEVIGNRSNKKSLQPTTYNPQPKLISQDPKATYEIVKSVRRITRKTLITKLSPNVSDIAEIAQAAACAGSDAVSLINTLYGMSIDIETKRPKLGNIIGGLSGPAIKPVALRLAWEVYQKVNIPIIGMGGIMDARDALEFIIAGATAISVGTANFINPKASVEIIEGIKGYLIKNKLKNMNSLVGSLKICP